MTASEATRAPRLLAGRAVRGAIAGLAVGVTLYVAFEYAKHDLGNYLGEHPDTDGLLVLGSIIATGLKIGVPLSYVVGLLVAWAVGLPRPWAVSFLGLLLSGLLVCVGGVLTQGGPVPGWLPIAMITTAFAGTAVMPLDGQTPS